MSLEAMNPEADRFMIKKSLLAHNQKEMPSRVGRSFSDVIDACLRFKELTEGLDELAMAFEFKARILEPLERTAKI